MDDLGTFCDPILPCKVFSPSDWGIFPPHPKPKAPCGEVLPPNDLL